MAGAANYRRGFRAQKRRASTDREDTLRRHSHHAAALERRDCWDFERRLRAGHEGRRAAAAGRRIPGDSRWIRRRWRRLAALLQPPARRRPLPRSGRRLMRRAQLRPRRWSAPDGAERLASPRRRNCKLIVPIRSRRSHSRRPRRRPLPFRARPAPCRRAALRSRSPSLRRVRSMMRAGMPNPHLRQSLRRRNLAVNLRPRPRSPRPTRPPLRQGPRRRAGGLRSRGARNTTRRRLGRPLKPRPSRPPLFRRRLRLPNSPSVRCNAPSPCCAPSRVSPPSSAAPLPIAIDVIHSPPDLITSLSSRRSRRSRPADGARLSPAQNQPSASEPPSAPRLKNSDKTAPPSEETVQLLSTTHAPPADRRRLHSFSASALVGAGSRTR